MKSKFCYTCIKAVILTISTFGATAKDYTADFFGIRSGGTALDTRAIQFGIDCVWRIACMGGVYSSCPRCSVYWFNDICR